MSSSKARAPALASVAVQLICQFLQMPDLLRFARCTSSFRAAADTPFALKYATLRFIYTPDRTPAELHALVIRHAALAVRWDPSAPCFSAAENAHWTPNVHALFAILAARKAPIVSFDGISSPPISLTEWTELLELPPMQSVRELRMTRTNDRFVGPGQDSDFLAKVATLPNLTSFTLIQRFAQHAVSFPALAAAPMLTDLTVLDAEWSSCLPVLKLFPGLKRLTVIQPCVRAGALHEAMASSLNLHRSLEHLELDGLHLAYGIGDLAESMAKFAQLKSVALRRIIHSAVWLTALEAAPALSSLVFEPLSRAPVEHPAGYLPDEQHSAGRLSHLMVAKPALKLTLVVWGYDKSRRTKPRAYLTPEENHDEPSVEAIELGIGFARLMTKKRLAKMKDRFEVLYL